MTTQSLCNHAVHPAPIRQLPCCLARCWKLPPARRAARRAGHQTRDNNYRSCFGRAGRVAGRLLPASVRRFPGPEDLAKLIEGAGFDNVNFRLFAGGIVALHTAEAA